MAEHGFNSDTIQTPSGRAHQSDERLEDASYQLMPSSAWKEEGAPSIEAAQCELSEMLIRFAPICGYRSRVLRHL
jgi:hypothetical protein